MIFSFSFHDESGRVVQRFFCNACCYDEAYAKADVAASAIHAHGIQYCDAKGNPKDICQLPHLVRFMRPDTMAPFGAPEGWELARTDCCVQQHSDCGVLIQNQKTGVFAIYDSRSIRGVNQKFAQWAANNQ